MTFVPADSPPIDFDHLTRQTFADRALERELLELFAGQCDALLPVIGDAGHPRQGALAAHTLKGSARAVGAWRLAALADQAETLLGSGGATGDAALMAELADAARAAQDAAFHRCAVVGRTAALAIAQSLP